MTERGQSLEVIGIGTVPELDADEVPIVRSRAGADFDGDGGSVIGHTLEFGVRLHDIGHVEERDHGLISALDEQELEGIAVEGNALQSGEDGVHGGATSDYKGMGQEMAETVSLSSTYCYQSRSYQSPRRRRSRAS